MLKKCLNRATQGAKEEPSIVATSDVEDLLKDAIEDAQGDAPFTFKVDCRVNVSKKLKLPKNLSDTKSNQFDLVQVEETLAESLQQADACDIKIQRRTICL